MRVAVFSTKPYDERFLLAANDKLPVSARHEFLFLEERLNPRAAMLAGNVEAVCTFVNDDVQAGTLDALTQIGCRAVVLRCAGFNNVDLKHAGDLNIRVLRVPAYSPYAVAEHALALILALNRRIHRAYNRVREGNFSLDGLVGFDLHGSTVGIIGTGKIGTILARTLAAMGCRVLGHDVYRNPDWDQFQGQYVELPELYATAKVISLHCPLTPETYHLINVEAMAQMQRGVMLINTGRGGLIDTPAIIQGLKSGHVGYLGLDVYEQEADLFFENLSETIIQDDHFQRLLTFPNVLITGHQAFFTETALGNIAQTTIDNLTAFASGQPLVNEVSIARVRSGAL